MIPYYVSRFLLVLTLFSYCSVAAQAQSTEYFQQEVNYTIDVTLNDVDHELDGQVSFEYLNNSNDNLPFIWVHLWPNAYKNETTALAKQLAREGNYILFNGTENVKGNIGNLDFKVNGEVVNWEFDSENIDICKVNLKSPLAPGQKCVVSTPFKVKIPSGSISRLGHIGQSYQITQWYPKPAVYDVDGWHPMPYLGQGEFYSEFGSFDVSITLPKNYVLGATGDRLNAEEEEEFLADKIALTEAYFKNPTSKEFESINSNEFPESSKDMKTVKFHQENIHDFAWFVDKRYLVLKGEVILPESGRSVDTWAMFTAGEADLWKESLEYIHDATYYYSLWNGDYPYNHVTAVDGTISAGGGMEYPNITVIGRSGTAKTLEVVIAHEVGHNWFYGILGSNERIHAWMDEGINSFNETRYMETKYPEMNGLSMFLGEMAKDGKDVPTYRYGDQFSYLLTAKNFEDQPMEINSDDFSSINYGTIAYKKSAFVLGYLQDYLGVEKFDECMHQYYDEWHFKHPKPKDIKNVFEKVCGEDLTWFFDGLVKTKKKLDFKLKNIKDNKDGSYTIGILNSGELKGPVKISSVNKENKSITESIWVKPMDIGGQTEINIKASDQDKIVIDYEEKMPDFNRQNNTANTKGLFKKIEPMSLKLGSRIDQGDETQLYWLPMYAWNEYDKNMIGLTIHNWSIPLKQFEYNISPLFSLSNNKIHGFSNFEYHREKADFGLSFQSFTEISNRLLEQQYLKISPEVHLKLNSPVRSRIDKSISLRSNYITRFKEINPQNELSPEVNESSYHIVNSAEYKLAYDNIARSYEIRIKAEQIIEDWGNFLYPVSVNANYSVKDNKGNDAFKFYAFGGKFIEYSNNVNYNWSNSGQFGINDYAYSGLYFGRTETDGLLSRQTNDQHGSIRNASRVTSNNWRGSLLAELKVPINFPIYIFAGGAYFDQVISDDVSDWNYDYTAGVSFKTEVFSIHVPLLTKAILEDEAKLKVWESITFELYLSKMNPRKLIRSFLK